MWKCKITTIVKTIWKNKDKDGGLTLLNFKIFGEQYGGSLKN